MERFRVVMIPGLYEYCTRRMREHDLKKKREHKAKAVSAGTLIYSRLRISEFLPTVPVQYEYFITVWE